VSDAGVSKRDARRGEEGGRRAVGIEIEVQRGGATRNSGRDSIGSLMHRQISIPRRRPPGKRRVPNLNPKLDWKIARK